MASDKARRAKFLTKADDLRACPFCRELFVHGEGDLCPECGIPVRDLAELPPSPDAERLIHEEAGTKGHAPPIPQAEPLPFFDMTRGRGVLLGCAVAGLVAFYLPWAVQTVPENVTWSAADLAHKKMQFWSAFTAWLVLFPAALSRRTLLKMHGARPALVVLASMPAVWCAFLLAQPTHKVVKGVPFEYHWGPGFWATIALSLVATFFALRFGGRLDDVKVRHGSSAGEVLH